MTFFTVTTSTGAYRSTLHPYKLVFQMKTRLELSEGPEISRYGLSLSMIGEICAHPPDYDYLV
ncbi:replication factor A protein, partial [Trifolium medium]|nr:replication factor A protein [Trifolium medium]